MAKIEFFIFPSGAIFTVAKNIEDYAHANGAGIRMDPDGTRHPGSVCNHALQEILKDNSARRSLGITSADCVQIRAAEAPEFLEYLIDHEIIHKSSLKDGMLDMYSIRAAVSICKILLHRHWFAMPPEDMENFIVTERIHFMPKKLSMLRERPSNSLLIDNVLAVVPDRYKVIDHMTEEEQAAVRKYSAMVRETRENGRQHVKRSHPDLGCYAFSKDVRERRNK